jgi:hypothetical protein
MRAANKKPWPAIERQSNPDILLNEDFSLDGAASIVADRFMRGNPAASSTIDALLYSLRKGPAALTRPDVQRRLAAVDEQQLRGVCKQLASRNPAIARSWTAAEVETFVAAWTACHHD